MELSILNNKDVIYGFILSAIIMLTILAWKDVLEHYLSKYFPKEETQITWKWIYAGLLTSSFIILNKYFQIDSI